MRTVLLKRGRDESLRRFHPWVFSGAIARIEGGSPGEGEVVKVAAHDGSVIGCGHWQVGSIAVRMLRFDDGEVDIPFWRERLSSALRLREGLLGGPFGNGVAEAGSHPGGTLFSGTGATDCCRLIHGEGDSLPGLIADWYAGVCVLQAHSAGVYLALGEITQALKDIFGERLLAVYNKSSATAPHKAGLDLCDGYLYRRDDFGTAVPHEVSESGCRFLVDWESGQKTGFFLDQRDNRLLVGKYTSGHRVLNLFCYSGGFSIYALAGGAARVDSVDSSERAVELARRNADLNGCADRHEAFCCDAPGFLRKCEAGLYNTIIVDPPAFAKHRDAVRNALRAYQRLNADAIRKVAPGGYIFTFSCSQAVSTAEFSQAVLSAAIETGRNVRILDRLQQGGDHPVNIFHPEGAYLKGLMLYVE